MKWSEEDMKEVIMHVLQHRNISATAGLHGVPNRLSGRSSSGAKVGHPMTLTQEE